jgi:glutathione-regulated potassium-efflux system ancillary protein KefC
MKFRRHSIGQLHRMAPHYGGDQDKLIALAKLGRQQLEELFAQERARQAEQPGGAGWHAADEGGPGSA